MGMLLGGAKRMANRIYRRWFSAAPSSRTVQQDQAWQDQLFRYYATGQPYTSPLTMSYGNMTGETWEMRQGYRQWAFTEPTAKAAVLTKCLAVCRLDPMLIPADKGNAQDRAAADWVKWSVESSDEGWGGLLFNLLVPALLDGFSTVEKVFGKVDANDRRYGGFWTLKKAASIDTTFIRYRLDVHRQIVGVQSLSGSQGGIEMDPRDFMHFAHLKMFENPFGISDMRAVVRGCQLIESAIRLRQILLTNFSGPFMAAKVKNAEARASMMAVMDQARANGWIVYPDGAELEVLNLASAASNSEFRESIEFHQRDIVTGIQGSYLQLLEGGIADGRGNTEVHEGIAKLYQWWLGTWVCQVINKQLIPDLVRPNYGPNVGLPRLQLGGVDWAAVKAAGERFKAWQELGGDLSLDQAADELRIERWKDEADRMRPPSQQQQQQPPPQGGEGDPFGGMFARVGGERGNAGSTGTFRAGYDSDAAGLID